MRYHIRMRTAPDDIEALIEDISDIAHGYEAAILKLRKRRQAVIRNAVNQMEAIEVERMKKRLAE
jgi:hypothetical protein